MDKTVLIAEDEPMLREMMMLELQEEGGLTARTAKNGEETIAAIDEQPPALLLLDLLMPKKDGYAVLQHIKDKGYGFPVIVLSNLSAPEEEEKCRALGVKEFVVKSHLDTGELWQIAKKYL